MVYLISVSLGPAARFCEPIHFTNYGKAEAFAAIARWDDHNRRKPVSRFLGPGGVNGKETAGGDQRGRSP